MEGKTVKKPGLGERRKTHPNCRNFEDWIQELMEYREEHGDCRIPKAYAPNKSLANWVRNMRQQRKKGKISDERIARLDELGFAWSRKIFQVIGR